MTNDIAHVSFRGGSIFLPVRTPYDREMLMEYITGHLCYADRLQVLLNDRRWLVQRGPALLSCARCAAVNPPAFVAAGSELIYCLRCAFGAPRRGRVPRAASRTPAAVASVPFDGQRRRVGSR